jgi:asparagine synthase (glutamine-hydrolysing)
MMFLDTITYLPDDILTKVDRASMAVGLEARVPLLDHRVAAFAFSLPRSLRLQGTTGKVLLRRVLARYVPRELFERAKTGFGIPIGSWLRGPLRDWAEALLTPAAIAEGGLAVEPVRQMWARHLDGRVDAEREMWTILMYQAWRARWDGR